MSELAKSSSHLWLAWEQKSSQEVYTIHQSRLAHISQLSDFVGNRYLRLEIRWIASKSPALWQSQLILLLRFVPGRELHQPLTGWPTYPEEFYISSSNQWLWVSLCWTRLQDQITSSSLKKYPVNKHDEAESAGLKKLTRIDCKHIPDCIQRDREQETARM